DDLVATMPRQREPAGPADAGFLVGFVHRLDAGRARGRAVLPGDEALDAAQEEADALLAILEDEPACRQPLAAPALDRLARHAEAVAHIADRQHRLLGLERVE